MKKFFLTVIFLLIALVVIAYVARNPIIKTVVQTGVTSATGYPLGIGSLDVNLKETLVDIKNIDLQNPDNFDERTMLSMPQIFVDYDLPAILKGNIHLKEVIINLEEFAVVKNADGELNIDRIKKMSSEDKEEKTEPKKPAEKRDFNIDVLLLRIHKVTYKDYSTTKPTVKTFNLNIDERFENVTDVKALASLIAYRALINTALPQMLNLNMGVFETGIENILGTGTAITDEMFERTLNMREELQGAMEGVGEDFQQKVKEQQQAVEETVEKTSQELKKSVESTQESVEKSVDDAKKSVTDSMEKGKKEFQNMLQKLPGSSE